MYYCTGYFFFLLEKCTKQTLNILISIPTTDKQEKKVPFEVKQMFYKHPKWALTGIPTQLQCMLVIQKHNTRVQINTKLMLV